MILTPEVLIRVMRNYVVALTWITKARVLVSDLATSWVLYLHAGLDFNWVKHGQTPLSLNAEASTVSNNEGLWPRSKIGFSYTQMKPIDERVIEESLMFFVIFSAQVNNEESAHLWLLNLDVWIIGHTKYSTLFTPSLAQVQQRRAELRNAQYPLVDGGDGEPRRR